MFEALTAQQIPQLFAHMRHMGVYPIMFVTQWFMCAFTSLPLWDTVLTIWDAFMFKGDGTGTRALVQRFAMNRGGIGYWQ